ncbi:hypothetical protein BCR35DRAFT_305502 [Leucosporidium creatinivorum]|uniref:DASH complex subunit DAM1 n=1 Tax=Leucosporidium creatinivorum TaxID=106004 RepID=A0A1Y2F0I0_9BASI|nr:hypothetical protein BCR35DRAFT_305502 [Leucosporidium creatinivorum]
MSRPTTPLRRISSTSLRQLSLSHSASRRSHSNPNEHPLDHLGPLFAELADSIADLVGKVEELSEVNTQIEGFNEAFSGLLYGLRVNTYTAEFLEAPTKLNFDLASLRQPPAPPSRSPSPSPSPPGSPSREGDQSHLGGVNMTMDSEHSFAAPAVPASRGRGGIARGRGRGRGGAIGGAAGRKKKEEQTAFLDSLLPSLPIKFREQQPLRGETERVCLGLRDFSAGVTMADLTASLRPPLPQHRVNDVLTALVRSKAVLKVFDGGVTTYRFDPTKFSPPSA